MRIRSFRALRAPTLSRLTAVLALAVLGGMIPDTASAQTARPCAPFDSTAAALSRFAVDLVSDTTMNARNLRTKYGVPLGTAADVTLVQDAAVCEAATASLEANGWPRQTDAVIVVRIGQGSPFYLTTPRSVGLWNVYLLNSQFVVLVPFVFE